ncbi:MAG TPA: F0F1 ATP synthase subunit gamma [Acidimicrobiales bacterium]|nr:F0F1 ATP synthase subunit gamma [Acidimicrobiales bacterium]
MAGGVERALRRRIRSVQSTKKITRAMELIAASRIVRAQQRVLAARPYIEQLTAVIANLARAGAGLTHPLLETRDQVGTVGLVVVTADRGLCGGYNANMQRAAERAIAREQAAGRDYRLVAVGRKGNNFFRYRNYRVDASFAGFSETPTYEDARAIAAEVMSRYESGDIDQVQLIYTRFLSLGSQRATERQFIPLDPDAIVERASGDDTASAAAYEFEPSPDEILAELLPRYVEARLFGALLEAAASEQVARQRAMKAATDNANELIKNLNRVANRARQESITTEIMEIVGGAEGMSQAAAKGHEEL